MTTCSVCGAYMTRIITKREHDGLVKESTIQDGDISKPNVQAKATAPERNERGRTEGNPKRDVEKKKERQKKETCWKKDVTLCQLLLLGET